MMSMQQTIKLSPYRKRTGSFRLDFLENLKYRQIFSGLSISLAFFYAVNTLPIFLRS